jgi:hypothetical protein
MLPAEKLIELLLEAANLNRTDPLRNGQMLCFPGGGDLVVSADLHHHIRNFERIVKYSDLKNNPNRHVIFQELIHGGALGPAGEDRSIDTLVNAMNYARQFPGQVHFLIANHDLAQVQRLAIMKDGYDLTDRFNRYLELAYGKKLPQVNAAFKEFVYSMPLAAITMTGIFLSHSLPGPRDIATFDPTILRRQLSEKDFERGGPIYQLIWGRNQTQDVLNALSKQWWADMFVCGHQQQDSGYGVIGDRMLIIDSSHNHGTYLRINLARQYTFRDLVGEVRPLASIG